MKKFFYLIIVMFAMISFTSCMHGRPYKLKGGYAITLEGDTIEFYGGTITYYDGSSREIRDITLKQDSIYYIKH